MRVHGSNGVIDDVAENEAEAMEMAKSFYHLCQVQSIIFLKEITKDDPLRKDDFLLSIIPKNKRESYDILPIIESVVDKNSFFELGKNMDYL